MVIVDSTISNNRTGNGGAGAHATGDVRPAGDGGRGGGIFGSVSATETTVSGNKTGSGGVGGDSTDHDGGNGGNGGDGGGIFGTSALASSTVSDNSTGVGGSAGHGTFFGGGSGLPGRGGNGGGISSSANIKNTIVAKNSANGSGPDCFGTLTSQGFNLLYDTSACMLAGDSTGNLTGQDPLLGPLQGNGGTTETHALLLGSPAIDAANPNGCTDVNGNALIADQRGQPRVVDGNGDGIAVCDVGAFELPGHGVSGHVHYYSNGLDVDGVTVNLSGPIVGTLPAMTGALGSGYYRHDCQLDAATGPCVSSDPWHIEPEKHGDVGLAISVLDAVYILQSIAGLRILSAEQQLAADVTGNGTVSVLDAVLILQYKAGLISQFPVATGCGSDWAFVPHPSAGTGIQPKGANDQCQRGAIDVQSTPATVSDAEDFSAVVFGDVTGNWQPTIPSAPLSTSGD
jgi:hypothetical protein